MIPNFINLSCITVGWLAVIFQLIDFLAYIFAFLLTGYAIVNGNLYISFVIGLLYWFSVFASFALSVQFEQPKPLCTLLDTVEFQEFRKFGMPSPDAFIFAVLITFLLGLQTLTQRGFPLQLELSMLVIYPCQSECHDQSVNLGNHGWNSCGCVQSCGLSLCCQTLLESSWLHSDHRLVLRYRFFPQADWSRPGTRQHNAVSR